MPAERRVAAFTLRPSGDDGKIVAALRVGDEHAFRTLFYRYSPTMKRVAGHYVDSDAVAEEVVQETWLAVVTGIERFEGRSALGTWILSILIHQATMTTATPSAVTGTPTRARRTRSRPRPLPGLGIDIGAATSYHQRSIYDIMPK